MPEVTFNYEEMLARCVGNDELVWRAIHRFQEELPCDLKQLKAACMNHDFATIQMTAHRIKGASANIAAHQLRHAAERLEAAAAAADAKELETHWAQLQAAIIPLEETFQTLLKTS